MPTLSWYMNRLGRMSPAELAYRLTQATRATTDRLAQSQRLKVPAPRVMQPSRAFICVRPDLDASPYVEQAERIMAGRWPVFHLEDCDLGCPPQWNLDPLTKRVAPLLHAASLDYRDEEQVGNIKYLWEPNRHLHLPKLAQAHALTGERRFALAIRTQIESWIEQCPAGRGPNWSSSLELAIRLINWSLTWQLLGGVDSVLFAGEEGRAFRDRWLDCVYRHAQAITRRLSRFSSANNHLIGETAGVWIASVTWNYWPQMRVWGLRCRQILEEEAFTQNAEDGGNREQAFAYQQFVLDFLLLAGLAARAAGEDFPQAYWQRIEQMVAFIASMMDAAGHVPMIGDADDGYVVSLSPRAHFDNYRSLLASGAVLFDRADFASKARKLDDKTRWLLGKDAVGRIAAGPAIFQPRRAFCDSGYYLLGDRFETGEEVRLLADAGPLGYLSIAAHGHADALGIVLNVGGHEVLVDPGTYAYHTEPQWRSYFRSTRAHNTVSVDKQDQSRQSGNFMWSRHANARCLKFELADARQHFIAEHDGYRSLSDPVTHRREIVYDRQERVFTILDTLECMGGHEVCRHWHFAEQLQPVIVGQEVQVLAGHYLIRLVAGELPERIDRYEGGTAQEGGWVSRRFGCKVPATTVGWRSSIRGTTVLRTYICVERVGVEAVSG